MVAGTSRLGTTDMQISRAGLGAWAIGGAWDAAGWGPQAEADSIATIHRAVELGVNWIDTAPIYGYGRSEEVVGRALAVLPPDERPLIFTKCGLVWEQPVEADIRTVATPATIRRELEDSLRRLGVDRVDLLQIHWPPDPPAPVESYWETMVELRAAGKVRAIGLSNHDVAQLETAEAIGHVDTLQPPFSALNRSAAPELAWCAEHGAGTLAYSPMASGLLTGAITAARVASMPEGDWRRTDPECTTKLPANLVVADALAPIAERHGVSRAAVAVAWVLAWPGLTAAIVGARQPHQVEEWIAGRELTLAQADLDAVAEAIERSGAGVGPVRP